MSSISDILQKFPTFQTSGINNPAPQHDNPEDLNPNDTYGYMHFMGKRFDIKTENSRFSWGLNEYVILFLPKTTIPAYNNLYLANCNNYA
jgi:hypothetical protein